jgi:hypothetical protein
MTISLTRKLINEVDANRFTRKTFSRRKTFTNSADDYCIKIDGLTAGRIMKKTLGFRRMTWFWTLTEPYFPGPKSHDGEEETLEKAGDAFKVCFWHWHAWALKQPGKVTWYGAEE